MGYWIVGAVLVVLAAGVLLLLDYFGNRKKFAWYTQITLFIAWLFPFSIILVLPLDLTSTLYRKCLEEGKERCDKPLAYVDEGFLWVFWQLLYWTMFNLTWFIIPLMQSWIRSGEFSLFWRLIGAIRDYFVYYAIVSAIGVCFLIYVVVAKIFKSPGDLLAFAMAGANAWGLLLVTVMLGYGLVEVPRGLWFNSNYHWRLRYFEFEAPKTKEAMVDAEAELYEVAREIALASKRVDTNDPLRPRVDKLLEKCPLATEERPYEDDEPIPDINSSFLRNLHERIKRATRLQERSQARYEFLLRKAFLLQDIVANENNSDRIFRSIFVQVKDDRYKNTKLRAYWLWFIYIKPALMKFIAVLCALATLVLVWSESTFQFNHTSDVTLSIPALLLQNAEYFILQFISTSFILYMCVCAYSSLFRVRIFDIYELVPEHHSDEGSLLFIGAYLCRLTFPICYNYLNMVGDDENSIFTKYQGKNVNLAPLLGENYNRWLPMVILVFCIVTLLNLHGRVLRLFKLKSYFYETISDTDADTEDGRQIIEQARKIEERRLARDPFLNYNSVGLSVSNDQTFGRRARVQSNKGQSTKDFLQRYKRGEIGTYTARGASASVDPDREALLGSASNSFGGSRFSTSSDYGERANLEPAVENASKGLGKLFGQMKIPGHVKQPSGGKPEGRKKLINDSDDDGSLQGSKPSRKFGVATGSTSPLLTSPATQRSTAGNTQAISRGGAPQTFKLGAFGGSSKSSSSSGSDNGGFYGGARSKPKPPPGNMFSDL